MKKKSETFPVREELDKVMRAIKSKPFLVIVNFADILIRYSEMTLINLLHYNTLGFLIRSGGSLTHTELAKHLFRSKHSITKVIDSLEKEGYVKRVRDLKDRRTIHIRITSAGLDLVEKNLSIGDNLVREVLSTLDKKEMDDLVNHIRRLRRTVIEKIRAVRGH